MTAPQEARTRPPAQPRRPFSLISKPTGAACNLDCRYCFFLSKEALWDARAQSMSADALRTYLAGHLHDTYRVNKAGRGTHDQVVRGWEVLTRHGVDTNILCTVNAGNADYPLEVYRHFRDDLGARFLQFIPIVERVEAGQERIAEAGWRDEAGRWVAYRQAGTGVTSSTVNPDAWGAFLAAIFDEWITRDIGEVFVQHVDVMLGARFGQYSLCVHAPECGTALVMEHNGDVYACDHFVEPGHRLGNVAETDFQAMLALPALRRGGPRSRLSVRRPALPFRHQLEARVPSA